MKVIRTCSGNEFSYWQRF